MIMIIFVVILIFKFNAGITNLHVSHSQPNKIKGLVKESIN